MGVYAKCSKGRCEIDWEEWPKDAEDAEQYATCKPVGCENQGDEECSCLVIIEEWTWPREKFTGEKKVEDLGWYNPFTPPPGGDKSKLGNVLTKKELDKKKKEREKPDKPQVLVTAVCECCKLREHKPYWYEG